MNFQDSQNFLKSLSAKKINNAVRVLSSYYYSKWTGKPIQWGFPFNISIEPTTSCNLHCPECPSGLRSFSRPTGALSIPFYDKILTEIGEHLIYLYFYFQGEPYLHPAFLDLVKKASEKNIYTVTSTNAHFLTERKAKETIESGLSRIIISIDGATQETYEAYRKGGQLKKVIEGTKHLVHWKKKLNAKNPHIVFQFLVVKPNEHQINDVMLLGKEIGVDEVKLKTAQIYDYELGSPLIPTIDQYSRYKKNKNGRFQIKNQLLNHCWKLWHSCVITWDGKVVPCCFDKDASHQLGDLNSISFHTIWNGDSYQNFRKQLLTARSSIDICTNCTEGTKVWA